MKAEDIMTRDVKCCTSDATLADAAQRMWENDCGSLPVCDSDKQVIGMITDRDICMAAWMKGRPLHELHVGEAMSQGIVCCRVLDPITVVENQMQDYQIHRLPVLDEGGRLAGIVSLADIVSSASDERGMRFLGTDHVVRTMAAVCRPRSRQASDWSRIQIQAV